jgi:hypothetical protein
VGLSSGVSAISAANEHICVVRNSGEAACWGDNTYGQLGDGTRTTSRVPVAVDFATRQTIVLRASKPGATIAPATTVTFTASASPLVPAGDRATVRFEIYRLERMRDGDVERIFWRLAARRDVSADAVGRATLRWTFVTSGLRYVRARALATATYAASPWSRSVNYTVG